jgi:hypothetical protein
MKRTAPEDLLARWLTAERGDREEEAEKALAALFTALPRRAPAAGFADRVALRLAQAAGEAGRVGDRFFARRAVRWAVAAALLVSGGFLVVLPALIAGLVPAVRPAALVAAAADLVAGLGRWVGGGLAVWEVLASISRAVAAVVATPTGVVVLTAVALVSITAFRLLADLLGRERSIRYVD